MNFERIVRLSVFLAVVSLATAGSAHAAWPTTEANRCWLAFRSDGTQVAGTSLVLHIVPVGRKASVVTGTYTNPMVFASPLTVTGVAAVGEDLVSVPLDVGSYDPGAPERIFWVFDRSTLEMGNVLKPVPCRGLPR